jgi:sulfoxide reductase catalytic subunit YedY
VERPTTSERMVAGYNNFYEFTTEKEKVARLAERFQSRPWEIELTGEVEKPRRLDVDELIGAMPLEERVYRLRCVEAWSVVVPWIGFPLKKFVEWARIKPSARYLRMVSFHRPDEAPGQRTQNWYPWPYFEGLTLAEATNELALLVVGSYGHQLPNQNGAPIRLIVPWKYGFKSIKSIVRFEFTRSQPKNFWNVVAPTEYDFYANVNPAVPHPRWSQATETDVATGKRIRTLPYNGYAEFVAQLYR